MARTTNIAILIMILLVGSVCAVKNPSAVYCDAMGYEFTVKETEAGQMGICVLPDGSSVDSWGFLKGKIGKEYSYCEKEGYVLKIIKDGEKCSSISSYECAVCVKDGEEIEVTELMNLDFSEVMCGDDVCVFGEDYVNCPEDCPSGSKDDYCDGVNDGICDPDCDPGEDLDCYGEKRVQDYEPVLEEVSEEIEEVEEGVGLFTWLLLLIIFLALVCVGSFLYLYLYAKRKGYRLSDIIKGKKKEEKPKPQVPRKLLQRPLPIQKPSPAKQPIKPVTKPIEKPKKSTMIQLKAFVNNSLKKGYTQLQIRQSAMKAGWSKEQIDEALKGKKSKYKLFK